MSVPVNPSTRLWDLDTSDVVSGFEVAKQGMQSFTLPTPRIRLCVLDLDALP